MKAFLSLGSNQGNRLEYLQKAMNFLDNAPGIKLIKASGTYETEPWGSVEQGPFLNMVVEVDTSLDPFQLLESCKAIEELLDRKRLIHWGPRTIDIDILTYNNLKIQAEQLIIPHPYMEQREFVLAPLREIAPDFILPSGKPILITQGEGNVKKIII